MNSTVLVAANINHAALVLWQNLQKLHVIPKSFPAVAATASVYNDIKTKTIAAFSDVFSDTLDNKPMCAQKMKIYLKQNAIPYRVSAPRPIPLRFQEQPTVKSLVTSILGLLSTATNQRIGPL